MENKKLQNIFTSLEKGDNKPAKVKITETVELNVYPKSVKENDGVLYFTIVENNEKYLTLIYEGTEPSVVKTFDGTVEELTSENAYLKKCVQTTANRKALQKIFPFTNAKTIGLENSFGFGDRLGVANPAHIRAVIQTDFIPVLSQQSIRELTRTKRTPAEVMDAAVWAVFQEGLDTGFGADADHLKTTEDIDLMVANGFRMFTFDPSEYVNNDADTMNEEALDKAIEKINWTGLEASFDLLATEYVNKEYNLPLEVSIKTDLMMLKRGVVKYGNSIAHIKKLFTHLVTTYPGYDFEVEVSVDETESVTTAFEHFFFAKELNRLKVKYTGLAPRFIGDFEKGIDYKGDLELFRKEYIKHIAITKYFGDYKISLHSGSDKFSVYKVIGDLRNSYTHIKTAGTSYLEALKVVSIVDPMFFREILSYCVGLYDNEKKTYHVSADLTKIKKAEEYTDSELVELFNDNSVRQVLHVTFGRVLTDRDAEGKLIFKDRLINLLKSNEELHYKIIEKHFLKHMEPFK